MAKPIPSYQVYKGTVFELVGEAVDFVLSQITLSLGTRVRAVVPRAVRDASVSWLQFPSRAVAVEEQSEAAVEVAQQR